MEISEIRRMLGDCGLEQELVEIGAQALANWFPNGILRGSCLPSGRTGAALVRLDVSGQVEDDMAGVYVLKIEAAAERGEYRSLADLGLLNEGRPRVPRVLKRWSYDSNDKTDRAHLFEIAGNSLRLYTSAARVNSLGLTSCIRALVTELCQDWAKPNAIEHVTLLDAVNNTLGSTATRDVKHVIDAYFTDDKATRYENGWAFKSPLAILAENTHQIALMKSFVHGDLHGGNILVPAECTGSHTDDYWLIDFDRAGEGYWGSDLAYLELSILCDHFAEIDPAKLANCLEHATNPERTPIPPDMDWLARLFVEIRQQSQQWADTLSGRRDDLDKQAILVRVIESLRWIRRRGSVRNSAAVLAYAGWHCREWDRRYSERELHSVIVDDESSSSKRGAEPSIEATVELSPEENEIWTAFLNSSGRLGASQTYYILIAERFSQPGLSCLGGVPWSAVVDLDHYSETDGLYNQAGPVLSSTRAVHVFTSASPEVDFTRGTAWLMADGLNTRERERLPFREWLRSRHRFVRDLFEVLQRRAGDSEVIAVVLPGDRPSEDSQPYQDRMGRILEAFDEAFGGEGAIHVLGDRQVLTHVPIETFPLQLPKVFAQFAKTFGGAPERAERSLPGSTGSSLPVPHSTLAILEEYFEVLHSSILNDGRLGLENDEFWKGGRIQWEDLAENRDVTRTVLQELTERVQAPLIERRRRTIVLAHPPGAGGTTVGLRCLWNLHRDYPSVVLRSGRTIDMRLTGVLADRLHQLCTLTGNTVVLYAESSNLPETYRDALFRELAERNANVVILYVKRSYASARGGDDLWLDPRLGDDEMQAFLDAYRQLATTQQRLLELERLATDNYEQYRTPFFFGLIAFQREFVKLSEYVQSHIGNVNAIVRDILSYLALVTLYTDSGLQRGLVEKLLGLKADHSSLEIHDLLGESATELIIQRNGMLRISHPLLAEQILRYFEQSRANVWRHYIADVCKDFIRDVRAVTDPRNEPIRLLFRQLFIDRVADGNQSDERKRFAPLIEELDSSDAEISHQILLELVDYVQDDPHFWNHLGRHQMFRLNRDLDLAEDYLLKAIEFGENDSIHYHTLGLVRRDRLRQALRLVERNTSLMPAVDMWFDLAVDCFNTARELSPNDIYPYVTHAQIILEITRRLLESNNVDSVADLTGPEADWVLENVSHAELLLESATRIYGELQGRNDLLRKCYADIKRLYGDLDAVVKVWELRDAEGAGTVFSRRSLALSYWARSRRSWRGLSESELHRIVELAEQNLRTASRSEADFRLWFEAKRMLPDFDASRALTTLERWSDGFPSSRASLYRYVLLFLIWFEGRSDDSSKLRDLIEESSALATGRKTHSYVWFGKDPEWCTLVADSDLGEWNQADRFWNDTSLLARVNGFVDVIYTPQSGKIGLGPGVQAFFVPNQGGFLRESHENVKVNFFLGFSPSGLRAWSVEPGHRTDARSRSVGPVRVAVVGRPKHLDYDELVTTRARKLRYERVVAVAESLVEARTARGLSTRRDWLEGRIRAIFTMEVIDGRLGESLSAILGTSGDVAPSLGSESVHSDADRRIPDLPDDDSVLGRDDDGSAVPAKADMFIGFAKPSKQERWSTLDWSVMLGHVYRDIANKGHEARLQTVGEELSVNLGDARYRSCLAGKSLKDVVEETLGWEIGESSNGNAVLLPSDGNAVDEAKLDDGDASKGRVPGGSDVDVRNILRLLFDNPDAEDNGIALTTIGSTLTTKLGRERYRELVGKAGLKSYVSSLPGVDVNSDPGGKYYVTMG